MTCQKSYDFYFKTEALNILQKGGISYTSICKKTSILFKKAFTLS